MKNREQSPWMKSEEEAKKMEEEVRRIDEETKKKAILAKRKVRETDTPGPDAVFIVDSKRTTRKEEKPHRKSGWGKNP